MSVALVLLPGSYSGLCFPNPFPVLLLVKVCITKLAALTCAMQTKKVDVPQVLPTSEVHPASIREQCLTRRNIADDLSAPRRVNAIPNNLRTARIRSGGKKLWSSVCIVH